MKTINLKKFLAQYQSGWVAINQKLQIVAHAKNFKTIADKFIKRKDVVLMPASGDYSGLVTRFNG